MTKAYIREPAITYVEVPDAFSSSLVENGKGFIGTWKETIKESVLEDVIDRSLQELLEKFDAAQKYGTFSGGADIRVKKTKNSISVEIKGSRKDAVLGILREILLQAKLVMTDDEIFALAESLEVKRDD